MGLDVRDIPRELVVLLPDYLRNIGFDVSIVRKALFKPHNLVVTYASCRRGEDTQVMYWCEEPDQEMWRVYISAAWGWRAATRVRRRCLQADLIAALDAVGNDSPQK